MKSKFLMAAAIAAAAVVALSACGGGSSPQATADDSDPFTLVYVGGVTGQLASLTGAERVALNFAIDQVNADGGIDGRKVELEVLDSKSDPTEAVSVLQKRLSESPKPDLVRTGLSSSEALAMTPVTTRAKIPSFSSAASPLLDDLQAYPYNIVVSSEFTRVFEVTRTWMEALDYQTMVMFAPEDASGDSNVTAAEEIFKGSDVKFSTVRYNPADVDLSVAYQRAIESNPDVVYANCLGAACPRIAAARLSVGGGTEIPMLGDASWAGSAGGPAASSPAEALVNLKLVHYPSQLQRSEAEAGERFQEFYDGLSEGLGGEVTSVPPATVVYDGFQVWVRAFEKAGTTDPVKAFAATRGKYPEGFFVTYGNAAVSYTDKSAFPVLPDDAFLINGVEPQVGGLYPPVDPFTFD